MNIKIKFHIIYLILHYSDLSLTKNTIQSILKIDGINKIIVVDNGSPNDSGDHLYKLYKHNERVDILQSHNNLGFSGGNNFGYKYIERNYQYDFIIALNNDIIIEQKDFIMQIDKLYDKTDFWVAGPDIYVPQRVYHSSPMYEKPLDADGIKELSIKWKKELIELEKNISLPELKKYIKDCKKNNFAVKCLLAIKRIIKGQVKDYKKYSEQCVLQGACIIFAEKYCKRMNCLFKPITFMYVEEDILTQECIRNSMKLVYCPEIKVNHLCEGSSRLEDISYVKYCEKRKKRIMLLLEAYRQYLDEYYLCL